MSRFKGNKHKMGVQPLLVRIVADSDCSRLLTQTPGGAGIWDGIRFTTAPVHECDYLVMLNNRKLDPVASRCPPQNVWAIMQEPYLAGLYDWLIEDHEPYARVYTHIPPSTEPRYIASQPAVPWHVGLSYDELIAAAIPRKCAGVSWVASNLTFLPGHRLRAALRRTLQSPQAPPVDLFGRGIRWVPRKWDVLAPYRYSLAIENSSGPDLWTEKIADCFLSWTVPLYYGCTNLERYFPEESFIRVNAADPVSVADRIRELLARDEWERRLPALEAARRLVLEKYQIFPFLADAIRNDRQNGGPKAEIVIPGYRARRWKHRARYIRRTCCAGDAADLGRVLLNKLTYLWWLGV
jgi:hypothetical protein